MTIDDLFRRYHQDHIALLAALQPYLVDQSSGIIPDTSEHGFEEPTEVRVEERVTDSANPYDFPGTLTAWEEGEQVRAILHTFDTVVGMEIITWYSIPQAAFSEGRPSSSPSQQRKE